MDRQTQTKEPGRHCAFCLVFIPTEKVRCCSGCKRRAYCSRECQAKDWSRGKQGQAHKNWCNLGCGEEDIDWEVVPVEGKGLGIIARRFIPAKFQIMVDPVRSKTHPGITDLMPLNGSIEDKLAMNSHMDGKGKGGSTVCLRIARANHNCRNNADYFMDETFNVGVLYAVRDIQEGEEICINYQPFNDVRFEMSPKIASMVLSSNWGIYCKETCICRNPEIEKSVNRARELKSSIAKLGFEGRNAEALEQVEQLLELQTTLGSNLDSKIRTLEAGFHISILEESTLHKAQDYIKQTYDIASKILSSPNSKKAMIHKVVLDKVAMFGIMLQNGPAAARSAWKSMNLKFGDTNSTFQTNATMFLAQKSLEELLKR